jgi:polyferredoxin
MRYSGNIFKPDSYRSKGTHSVSGVMILTIVLSLLSLIAGIYIIVRFYIVTAVIAYLTMKLLSSGAVLLIIIVGLMFLFGGCWRRRYRGYW